jgi:hypothetical protein
MRTVVVVKQPWKEEDEGIECFSGIACTSGRWFHFKYLIRGSQIVLSEEQQLDQMKRWSAIRVALQRPQT